MNGLTQTLKVGDNYSTLTKGAIESITLNGNNIAGEVSGLTVDAASITANDGATVAPAKVTEKPGTYTVSYTVVFVYSGKTITRSFTQTVAVTE